MQIINKKNSIISVLVASFALAAFGVITPIIAQAATSPSLGAAAEYGILSSTYINVATSTVNGSVGFTSGPAVAPGGTHANYGVGAPYSTAGTDQGSALATGLTPQLCTFDFAAGAIDLSTDSTHGTTAVFTPGVYCVTGAMNISGPLTLSGSGTYIFRSTGALGTTDGSIITMSGANACDVFWTPGAATTLGANTTFFGNVIDASAITVGAVTNWTGRALAFGGVVTTGLNDVITVPTCAAQGTLNVIKLLVHRSGRTAVASDFSISVKNAGVNVVGSPQPGTTGLGTAYSLSPGTYVVSETQNGQYQQTFTGDCDEGGTVTMAAGNKICTVVNTDIPRSAEFAVNVPLIGILKVPTPLTLPAGAGSVTYDYTVWNPGANLALTDVTVVDDKCSAVTLVSGDLNSNAKLEPAERWHYSCVTNLAATTTNTAVATGYSDDSARTAAIATAVATVAVGIPVTPPLINIVKVPDRLIAFPFGGGNVTYTYTVTNPGIVAMHDVTVLDDKCATVTRVSGDTNNDNLFQPSETWTYTCTVNVPVTTRNVATAKGEANGFTAIGYAFANVLVLGATMAVAPIAPIPTFPNTGLEQGTGNNIAILAGLLMLAAISLFFFAKKRNI